MMREQAKRFCEKLSRINRKAEQIPDNDGEYAAAIRQLRDRGYVMLDHLVGSDRIKSLKEKLDRIIEHDVGIEFPCLAQARIDTKKHKDMVDSNFLADNETLAKRNLAFGRDDVSSYRQMLDEFKPSTLKVPMVSDASFYDCWLDEKIMAIVEGYMGFIPHMTEGYVRRNFPARYAVMNHNWHRDTNHPDYLVKAFIFFTDCDLDTGAHHYIAGSIQDSRFRDKPYFTDTEIETVWPLDSSDHITTTVPAGTIIIEDTRGLHKAGIPKRDYRDLGYAIFTPPNFMARSRSLYQLDRSVYDGLTERQKRYIPKGNIGAEREAG